MKKCFSTAPFGAFVLGLGLLAAGCGTSAVTESTEAEVITVTESTETEAVSETVEAETETVSETEAVPETETEVSENTFTFTDLSQVMYAKSTVNVRDLPDSSGNKVGSLAASEEVSVTGQCNETGWYRISYNNTDSYVSDSYLVSEKPAETENDSTTTAADSSTAATDTTAMTTAAGTECPYTLYQMIDEGGSNVYYYGYREIDKTSDDAAKELTCIDTCGNILAPRAAAAAGVTIPCIDGVYYMCVDGTDYWGTGLIDLEDTPYYSSDGRPIYKRMPSIYIYMPDGSTYTYK